MKNEIFDVNTLRVASPCSVGWETMSGDERSRHCNSCKLNVYNISALTKIEVENLITKREGRVCVRLYKRADGTILTKDCPIGFRAYQKRVARFAGAALATILGLFSVSFGQKEDNKVVDASKVKIVRQASQKTILSGQILDVYGAVVPGIEIKLYKNDDKNSLRAISNDEGNYQIENLSAGIYTLEIKARAGFKKYKAINLKIEEEEKSQFDITLELNSETTTVGLLSEQTLIDTNSSSLTTTITRRQIEDLPH